jgi:hypothetical protein
MYMSAESKATSDTKRSVRNINQGHFLAPAPQRAIPSS